MAAFGRVRMREFVYEKQRGLARKRAIEIEFLDNAAPPFHFASWKDFETARKRLRFNPAMGLDEANNNIDSVRPQTLRILQHGKRFPDSRRSAKKYFQAAPPIATLKGDRRIRIRPPVRVSRSIVHWPPDPPCSRHASLTHPARGSAEKN